MSTNSDLDIGGRLRQMREAAEMSQAELAAALDDAGIAGMYPQTITKIEQGRRAIKFTEGMAMCRLLGANPSELFDIRQGEFDARKLLKDAEHAWSLAELGVRRAEQAENAIRAFVVEVEVGAVEVSLQTHRDLADAARRIRSLLSGIEGSSHG